MLLLLISFHYATSLLGFRRTLITAQHHHVAIENTEIIILFTTSFTTLSHVEKNPTMLHFLRCRKGPDDIILSVISLAGQAMGWHHLRSGLQESWLLLNDNYHGSWGASIFYNLVVVSTFLCKGSRDTHTHTHTHTGWEWGPHGPRWFNSIWQNPLGRAEGEKKMEREREREGERERERHGERGVRETLQGPLLPTTAIKWKQELSVYPPKPPMHESGREAH